MRTVHPERDEHIRKWTSQGQDKGGPLSYQCRNQWDAMDRHWCAISHCYTVWSIFPE